MRRVERKTASMCEKCKDRKSCETYTFWVKKNMKALVVSCSYYVAEDKGECLENSD